MKTFLWPNLTAPLLDNSTRLLLLPRPSPPSVTTCHNVGTSKYPCRVGGGLVTSHPPSSSHWLHCGRLPHPPPPPTPTRYQPNRTILLLSIQRVPFNENYSIIKWEMRKFRWKDGLFFGSHYIQPASFFALFCCRIPFPSIQLVSSTTSHSASQPGRGI